MIPSPARRDRSSEEGRSELAQNPAQIAAIAGRQQSHPIVPIRRALQLGHHPVSSPSWPRLSYQVVLNGVESTTV